MLRLKSDPPIPRSFLIIHPWRLLCWIHIIIILCVNDCIGRLCKTCHARISVQSYLTSYEILPLQVHTGRMVVTKGIHILDRARQPDDSRSLRVPDYPAYIYRAPNSNPASQSILLTHTSEHPEASSSSTSSSSFSTL
jgi:hypothetical protein